MKCGVQVLLTVSLLTVLPLASFHAGEADKPDTVATKTLRPGETHGG